MVKNTLRIIILLLVLTGFTKAYSSTSVSASNDSVIDVPSYLIASWQHASDKVHYDNSKWYNNTSFTFNLSPELMWNKSRYDYNIFNFGFSLNKEFDQSNALSVGMEFATRDKRDFDLRRIGAEIGYVWNLTNFYYGFDNNRRYSVMATTGADAGYVSSGDYKKAYYGGYLGFRFNHTITLHTTLFIEPRLGIYSDSYDGAEKGEGIDVLTTAHLGLNYKLSEMLNVVPQKKEIAVSHMKNWFFEIGGDVFLPVPKVDYETADSKYSDNINFGTSVAVGYRVNPLTSARVRLGYAKDRYSDSQQYMGAANLMVSGTNLFIGENIRRYVDMSLLLGPLVQFSKIPDDSKLHLSWGGEIGLQFTRRLSANWEIFAEPRYQLVQDYTKDERTDSKLKQRWDVNMGLIYIYQNRLKEKYDRWEPLKNWYIQTLFGAQLESVPTSHQIGSFDFAVGRNFGPLWSLRASIFSGELKSDEPNYDDSWNPMFVSYYGGRAEIVMNMLRMITPKLETSRWNWNISGGLEGGALSNHYHHDFGVVLGSQLQYRIFSNTWITAGGRLQNLFKFDAKLPLSGHIGVQYDLNNKRRIDILTNYWRWYIQGDFGFRNSFFNMDNKVYGAAFGMNIDNVHGLRLEFIGSKSNKGADGAFNNWMSLSPEYVYNISNRLLGEDDKRRVDVELFSGIDVDIHHTNFKGTKFGLDFGTQINANINDKIALFVQPRFSIQPWDKILDPTSHNVIQYFTLIGIRYNYNKFKSTKE